MIDRHRLIELLAEHLTYDPAASFNAAYNHFDEATLGAIADGILDLDEPTA